MAGSGSAADSAAIKVGNLLGSMLFAVLAFFAAAPRLTDVRLLKQVLLKMNGDTSDPKAVRAEFADAAKRYYF